MANHDEVTSPTDQRFHIQQSGNNGWKVDLVGDFAAQLRQLGFTQDAADADGWVQHAQGDMVINVSPNGSVSCSGRKSRLARSMLQALVEQARQRYLAEADRIPPAKSFRLFKNSASGWQLRPVPGQNEREAVKRFIQ